MTASKTQTIKEIPGGFRVLPVQIPHSAPIVSATGEKLSLKPHLILIKQHQVRQQITQHKLPSDRTLFLSQLPVCTTVQSLKAHLQQLFRDCGKIESISLAVTQHSLIYQSQLDNEKGADLIVPSTFCYAVFDTREAIQKALNLSTGKCHWWSTNADHTASSAIQRWKQQYDNRHPDREEYRERVESKIIEFDREQEEKQNELKALQNKPDENGWITVTRVDRRNRNTDGKTVVAAANPHDLDKLKPKEHLAPDFYRFQMRQDKREKLMELRKKFEEDKKRLVQLKANRRFKPY